MKDRYIIREAETYGRSHNELVDTVTGAVIFSDRMEPEDATLTRDLSPLVRQINALSTALDDEIVEWGKGRERIKELEHGLSFALHTIDNLARTLDESEIEEGEEEIEWVRELIGQKRETE